MVKCDFVILYLQISKCYLDVSTFKMNFYIHLDFQIKLVKVGQEDPENKNQDFSVMQWTNCVWKIKSVLSNNS